MQDPYARPPEAKASQRYIEQGRVLTFLVGAALTLLLTLLATSNSNVVERLNNAFIDIQVGLLPKKTLSPLPVIVEVDETSLAAFGQWPWPRYQVAQLLDAIKQAGASAVGVDAVFVEKDRTSPAEIQRMLEQDLGQKLPLTGVNEALWDYDAILGQTLKSGPYVASYFFSFGKVGKFPCQPKAANAAWLATDGTSTPSYLHQAAHVACNVPTIQEGASASGFINSAPDSDGIYRKTPLIIQYTGQFYPSLGLQTFFTANAIGQFFLSPSAGALNLQWGETQVPLDLAGNLLIKFPARGQGFKKISAHDLLTGKLPAGALRGNIVFVGVSAFGLHEVRPTPYDPQFLGVEFHAAIVDNLVRKDFLQRPANAVVIEVTIATILGLAIFVCLANARFIASVIFPCLSIIVCLIGSQMLLSKTGIVISPALPVLMTLIAFLVLTLLKYAREYLRAKHMTLLVAITQEGIIGGFCSMSEYRDPETGAHIKRTQEYVKALAKHLQKHPKFKAELTNEAIELMFKAAPLHDIGKIGIRDYILLKPDRLDADEFEIMKSHPQIGAGIIKSVATQIGWNPFMKFAHEISLCHQEKWDGSGYPQGLSGEQIPLSARLMAIADVYDALISKRVYKPALPHAFAVGIIKEGKSSHFDPLVVEAFEAIHNQFKEIALRFLDNEDQKQSLLDDKTIQ